MKGYIGGSRAYFDKGLKPLFLSLFAAEDGEYAERLAREFDADYILCRNAEVCTAYLSRARFLISSRLHGLVYATSVGLPMLAFTDDVKLLSYMETIGLGARDEISLVCEDSEGEGTLLERLNTLLTSETEIREHLLRQLPTWRAMAESEIYEIMRLLT